MSSTPTLNVARPWELINQCPSYQATPLAELISPDGNRVLIKDETSRFNLGAFKALGGIYAVAAFLQDEWVQTNNSHLAPEKLFEKKLQEWSNQFTFVCASAGNHGMAVAKGAQLFNAKSRVYLADTVPESFATKLRELNAEVVRSGATYEDSMNAARLECEQSASAQVLLADSSWPGYTQMPTLVMEGYTVLAEELRQTFISKKTWPTHVFLQAGVGGLAAAIAFHIRKFWEVQPQIIVVEPDAAPCLFESHKQGKLTTVTGPVSSMGRLDCKEASMIAFDILQTCADSFVCISETQAETSVAFLQENSLETTPSGAAGMAAILSAASLEISIEDGSVCLAIVTEGRI